MPSANVNTFDDTLRIDVGEIRSTLMPCLFASARSELPTFSMAHFDGPYDDFPVGPIVDGDAPDNADDLFGDPNSGEPTGGPCLVEPEIGTLFPRNWLRPRFSWLATGGQNLFELRITAENETNPLVRSLRLVRPAFVAIQLILLALALAAGA
jgi:hypothetical protein